MSENRCVCCSAATPEGGQVCGKCESGTGRNVGTKNADQMFREIGYVKTVNQPGHISYDCPDTEDTIFVAHGLATFTDMEESYAFSVGVDKILACAKLIQEMEGTE